jgi:hypothetical protein
MNRTEAELPTGRALSAEAEDPRVTQGAEEYRLALEAGRRLNRAEFLARHAAVAAALAECLDALDLLPAAALRGPRPGRRGDVGRRARTAGAGLPTAFMGGLNSLQEWLARDGGGEGRAARGFVGRIRFTESVGGAVRRQKKARCDAQSQRALCTSGRLDAVRTVSGRCPGLGCAFAATNREQKLSTGEENALSAAIRFVPGRLMRRSR